MSHAKTNMLVSILLASILAVCAFLSKLEMFVSPILFFMCVKVFHDHRLKPVGIVYERDMRGAQKHNQLG